MAIVETRYAVPGWGLGELWTENGVLLNHDFHFDGMAQSDDLAPTAARSETNNPVSDTDVLVSRLRAFLRGEEVAFSDVSVDLEWATPFQRSLVETLRSVPRGDVVSYGELAALAGRTGAARAAGALCAGNRFAFVVPCHRVVAANGIGGYGSAGIEVKRRLLALEGVRL